MKLPGARHLAGQAHRWLPIEARRVLGTASALVIVSVVTACDNVEWAGAEVALKPPPPTTFGARAEPDTADEDAGPRMPEGPILYMATRDSTGTSLAPVAVISGDSLAALPEESQLPGFRAAFARQRMSEGTEYVLFAGGTRVGTLTAQENFTDETFCQPRPAVRGPVELIPSALETTRFLALQRQEAGEFGHGGYEPLEWGRLHHIASINLMGELIPQVGALWPTNLVNARQDQQAFRLGPDGPPAFAATFVFRDAMGIAEAESTSYALFLMGVLQGEDYRPAFVWYREAGRSGRGVPRYFNQLDWDRDGDPEVLLEVLGERSRWTAAVSRSGDDWIRVWQDPCGADAPPVTDDDEEG